MNEIEPTANPAPFNALFTEVYAQLRKLARGKRSASDGDTLNTTALVHELYLSMCNGSERFRFENQRQFYAYAAQAMRHLLVDRARARARIKHGGDLQRVELTDSAHDAPRLSPEQALAMDAALRELSADDPRAAEVLELHYFAGLQLGEIAELLQLSRRTVDRDWSYARAFLQAHFEA